MTAPDEASQELLKREMVDVASMQGGEDFLVSGMDPQLLVAGGGSAQLANLMAVYRLIGSDDPMLGRLDLPQSGFSPDTIEDLLKLYSENEGKGVPAIHNEIVRAVAGSIASACLEIDEAGGVPDDQPVRILGMLGIYTNDGENPLPIKFLNKRFLRVLVSRLPGSADPGELTEEELRDRYSSISEYTEKPPFEEWKVEFERTQRRSIEQTGSKEEAQVIASMHMLLLPKEVSPPVLEAKLF